MLSPGLTGMLGLGDGVVFVWFLTLLVKKKEKRGRRLSAGWKAERLTFHNETLASLRFEKREVSSGFRSGR